MRPEQLEETPRAAARRRQVLRAASVCFRRSGFHAASMAQVAAEAGMSVGHIYRYFDGKEEIIAAIVRQDIDRILATLTDLQSQPGDLRALLLERAEQAVADSLDPERGALMIEIRAEASRNPVVHKMVRDLDREVDQQTRGVIRKVTGADLSEADLVARIEMFALIFNGMAFRSVINPDVDRVALTRLVRLVIDTILR
jgi:AcrR family transcriptional regulator